MTSKTAKKRLQMMISFRMMLIISQIIITPLTLYSRHFSKIVDDVTKKSTSTEKLSKCIKLSSRPVNIGPLQVMKI